VGIVDAYGPTSEHGTPPSLLRCELEVVGYHEISLNRLTGSNAYLAMFAPPTVRSDTAGSYGRVQGAPVKPRSRSKRPLGECAKTDIDCQDDRPRPLWNLRSGPWLRVGDFLTFSGRHRVGKINLWTG